MNTETRLRYETWRRRKIRKLIFTTTIIIVIAVGTFSILQSFGNQSSYVDNEDYVSTNLELNHQLPVLDEDDETKEFDDTDENAEQAVENNEQKQVSERQTPPQSNSFPELYAVTISHIDALSYTALVNRNWRLDSDFSPTDLRVINVASFHGNHSLRASAANAAESMFLAASEDGHILVATSGYRSYWTQQSTHNHWINVMGETEARRVSARPGHSEHQLGLALDITTHALGGLSEYFSFTNEGTWVRYNAHRFGFIVRYPYGREACTGYIYEPWHIRFVGIEAATTIFNDNLILEEFLGRW